MKLRIDRIRMDGGTQPRARVEQTIINQYVAALEDGAQFPEVKVFHDGSDYWLADGFHRVKANQHIGSLEIDADIKQGSRRDAVLFSVGANALHGLNRTPEDKKRAVMVLLEDAEWSAWSNREIARRCAVSPTFVSSVRPEPSVHGGQIERKFERGGTVSTMNTSGIGKRSSAPVQPHESFDLSSDLRSGEFANPSDATVPVGPMPLAAPRADMPQVLPVPLETTELVAQSAPTPSHLLGPLETLESFTLTPPSSRPRAPITAPPTEDLEGQRKLEYLRGFGQYLHGFTPYQFDVESLLAMPEAHFEGIYAVTVEQHRIIGRALERLEQSGFDKPTLTLEAVIEL